MEEWFRTIEVLCVLVGIRARKLGWWPYNKLEKKIMSIWKREKAGFFLRADTGDGFALSVRHE